MTESSDSRFTEAIKCLETGNLEEAETMFLKLIQDFGADNEHSQLSYKSLIGIYSEMSEYTAALNTSLDLLDAQVKTNGIRHADTTKTINNIYTLCNTLGKHELAKEIMSMAKAAEEKTVKSSVKKMRKEEAELEPEEEEGKIELPGAETMIGKITAPVNSAFDMMGRRLKRVVCLFLLTLFTVIIFGGLSTLRYLEKPITSDEEDILSKSYISSSADIDLQFSQTGKAVFKLGSKKFELPTTFVYDSWSRIGSLLLTPVTAKEFWLFRNAQGINGLGNYTLYASDSTELDTITMMRNLARKANTDFHKNQGYPYEFKGDDSKLFTFTNPYTLRVDYPIVQEVKLPDKRFRTMDEALLALKRGSTWTQEAFAYPGAINCGRIVAETKNSFIERFVIHGYDRYANLITQSDGNAFLLVSSGGEMETGFQTSKSDLSGASRIAIISKSLSGYAALFKYRLTIFYSILGLSYLLIARFIPDKVASVIAAVSSFICFALGAVAAFVWFLPI